MLREQNKAKEARKKFVAFLLGEANRRLRGGGPYLLLPDVTGLLGTPYGVIMNVQYGRVSGGNQCQKMCVVQNHR